MKNHTPAPWKFAQYTVSDVFDPEDLARQIAMHPNYFEVASEFDANYKRLAISGHIGEANARLIASAPDLLEALEMLLHDRTPWTVQCAKDAIAKAIGEPS